MPEIPRNRSNDDESGARAYDDAEDNVRSHESEEAVREDARDEQSRVLVIREGEGRPQEGDDDEYKWHTGKQRPHGAEDAVEFIDVHKAFGRNKILRGLNMGLPEGKISMIIGP